MSYLPSAKRNRELNTLALCNKAPYVVDLEIDVMLFGQRAHLDFLDSGRRRMALGVVRLFLLRVAVFVEVGDTTYGRLCRRSYLDQVQAAAFGDSYRFTGRHDTDRTAVGIDR